MGSFLILHKNFPRQNRGQENKGYEWQRDPTPGGIWIWRLPPITNLRPAHRTSIELAMYCYTASAKFKTILQKYWYFTEVPVFLFHFFNSTPPQIPEISAPFAISVGSIKTLHPLGLFMTKPQLPTHRNYLSMASKSQLELKIDLPCIDVRVFDFGTTFKAEALTGFLYTQERK